AVQRPDRLYAGPDLDAASRGGELHLFSGCALGCTSVPDDADLRRVIEAWPKLLEPVRAGILAMVQSTLDQPEARTR
ncbi:MAG: hypothetical protein V3U67_01170, partial [Gemmatimonadota bacterium]